MWSVLAADMASFWKNLNWWSLIDLAVFLVISIIIIVFFHRRNSARLAIVSALYILLCLGAYAANALIGGGFMAVSIRILDYVTVFLIVAVVVVYQSDFKVLANKLAHGTGDKDDYDMTEEKLVTSANEIVKACQNMAKNDVGALIIIARSSVPPHLLDTGTTLNANVGAGLLESIFSTKGPLHDGAVVIKSDKVLSAACFLPLSQEVDIAKELGTRHRAAIGITEESDVFAIVVSEETGIISTVTGGQIKRYMTPEKLLEEIKMAYGIIADYKKNTNNEKKRERKFL